MAGSAGSIYVDLLLRDARYKQSLNTSAAETRRWSGNISRNARDAGNSFQQVLNPVNNLNNALGQLGLTFASAFSVNAIIDYSDRFKQINARLGLAVEDSRELAAIQNQLTEIASRTRQPLESVFNLYSRIGQVVPKQLQGSLDILGITEALATSLAITGESSLSAQAAIVQFTQALATNFEASGQELRSIQEQAPRFALALQRSLGDGTKSLQQLKEEGLLTTETLGLALRRGTAEFVKLQEELKKIPPTTRQAFTELNNAFLIFIGQSEAVGTGTNILALGIRELAQNLELVIRVVATASLIFAGRFLSGINLTSSGFGRAVREANEYQRALAGLGVVNAERQLIGYTLGLNRASIATNNVNRASIIWATTLTSLRTALSGFVAFLGGPLGVALLAAGIAFQVLTDALSKTEKATRLGELATSEYIRIQNELVGASDEYRLILKQQEKEITANAVARIEEAEAILKQTRALQFFLNLLAGVSGGILGEALTNDAEEALRVSQENLIKLRSDIAKTKNSANDTTSNGSSGGISETNKLLEEQARIFQRYQSIITGVEQKEIDRTRVIEDLTKLLGTKYIPNQEALNEAIKRYDESLAESAEATKLWSFDVEAATKRAAENIQDNLADFLFDPFQDGLRGMLLGFVNTLKRMAAEAASARILNGIFGSGSGVGNFLGDILGGNSGSIELFNFGGQFAKGGYLEPNSIGLVGEKGPELIMSGNVGNTIIPNNKIGGGNTYNIDARGADQGAVTRLEKALLALAGPGVIEKRVSNAQVRGAL